MNSSFAKFHRLSFAIKHFTRRSTEIAVRIEQWVKLIAIKLHDTILTFIMEMKNVFIS